ncbi:MAG: hypothetical protein RLZ98_3136 [Pseudomonadota bacterium]|jgi:hypothetical protein
MNPRLFTGLAAGAVASLILAIVSHGATERWTSGSVTGVRLFPNLATAAKNAKTIKLTKGETVVTMTNEGGKWIMKDRGSFAVDDEKIRRLMVKLAGTELIEPKTKLPDRYKLLELENPTGKDAKSRLLHIADASGSTLAELVMGKQRYDAFGTGKSGTYVRKPGDPQTWLVNATLDSEATVAYWAHSQIVYDSERERIQRITVEIPGVKPPLVIEAEPKRTDDRAWLLVDMPADKQIKIDQPLDSIANGFTRINLEDVRPITEPPSGPDLIKATLEEKDGLIVTFLVRTVGKQHWLTLSARSEGEKAKARADKINADAKGWEYRIPDSKYDQVIKKRDDILEPKKQEGSKPN